MRWLIPTLVAILALGCDGDGSRDVRGGDSEPTPDAEVCAENRNDQIRLAMMPQCSACHTTDTNLPFFATLRAFEEILVYNPAYVNPADIDGSLFVELLEGRGTGTFAQMPLGSDAFAVIADRGETDITMAEIRDWLANLPPPRGQEGPDVEAPTTRRIKAEVVKQALLDHLGLDEERDFVGSRNHDYLSETIRLKGPLPLYSEDAAPRLQRNADHTSKERMAHLGAPGWLNRRSRSNELTPGFLQTLVQVSQAWCQLAVDDGENTALFREVGRDVASADDADGVRRNLQYLFLRFIGDVATDAEVNTLYNDVFLHYEAQSGPRTGWRAVCAALIRHPRWLSY
jgi:hypothetical protein